MSNQPIDRKVYAATIGAGTGTIVSDFVMWAVDTIWWPANDVNPPGPVAAFVNLVVPAALAFALGWLAKPHANEADV